MTCESSGVQEVSGSSASPAVLTFLIADVRGYTRFTLERGDEAAARLARRFAEIAEEVVARHDGDVIELRGDEALCVFRSVRNALRCSLALQRAFSQAASDPSLPLNVGIGLDAGEAIPVGRGYRGAALNLAARLCSLAGPGEVLASAGIIHLARKVDDIVYSDRGQVQLKGFGDLVAVLEVREDGGDDPQDAGSDARATGVEISTQELPIGGFLGSLPANSFVGRERELAEILDTVDAVAGNAGRLVLLAGEPGAGKTRLAQEVTVHLRNGGVLVAAGRCYEPEQSVAYYPFLDVLATLFAAVPHSMQREIARDFPYLGVLLPDQIGPPESMAGGGVDEQQRVFRAVTGFLTTVARDRPVAILLDDLQWSDSSSLKMLLHTARHTVTMPVLIIGTYRDVDVGRGHPLEGALRDLRREGLVERVDVRRLSVEDTGALVASTLGEDEVSPEFAELLYGRTEGNPYFVQQVLKVLVERGDVFHKDGVWDRRALEEIDVPESVRSVVGQRLSRLSQAGQEALQEASALGQSFGFDDLAAISRHDDQTLDAAMEEAIGAGLVSDLGRARYSFDHALTQQSIYAELSSRRKRRLHLMAGEALERLPTRTRNERLAEIVWHFLEADDPVRAAEYSILAGNQAEAVFAHAEAESHYQVAVHLAREVGNEATEAKALEKLGEVLEVQSLPDRSLEALEAAAAVFHATGDLSGEARVTAGIGSALMHLGNSAEAVSRLRTMLSALEAGGPTTELASLSLQLGAIVYGRGQYGDCLDLMRRTHETAVAIGDVALAASADNYRGDVLMQLGRCAEARTLLETVIPEAEAAADSGILAHTLHDLAATHLFLGEFAQCRSYLSRVIELQRKRESPAMIAFAQAVLGMTEFYEGDWIKARSTVAQAVGLIRDLPRSWQVPFVLGYAGLVEMAAGSRTEATMYLEQAISLGVPDHVALPLAHQVLAEREILDGDPDAARARLERLPGEASLWTLMMRPTLAWAQLETGDAAAADDGMTRLISNDAAQMRLLLADAMRLQAVAHFRQGRAEEAEEAFEGAIALARSMPYPQAEGRALYEMGQMHAQLGDREAGRKLLMAAADIFAQVGAADDAKRAQRALTALMSEI